MSSNPSAVSLAPARRGAPGATGTTACPKVLQQREGDCDNGSQSIREVITLPIAPNLPGLSVGNLVYYADGPNNNFGSRQLLEFNSLPTMEALRVNDGNSSRYTVSQWDSAAIRFTLARKFAFAVFQSTPAVSFFKSRGP